MVYDFEYFLRQDKLKVSVPISESRCKYVNFLVDQKKILFHFNLMSNKNAASRSKKDQQRMELGKYEFRSV